MRLTAGKRAPLDLTLDQAARLVAELAAAVRLAQHHETKAPARTARP